MSALSVGFWLQPASAPADKPPMSRRRMWRLRFMAAIEPAGAARHLTGRTPKVDVRLTVEWGTLYRQGTATDNSKNRRCLEPGAACTAPVYWLSSRLGRRFPNRPAVSESQVVRHSRALRVRKPARQQVWKPNVTRISAFVKPRIVFETDRLSRPLAGQASANQRPRIDVRFAQVVKPPDCGARFPSPLGHCH